MEAINSFSALLIWVSSSPGSEVNWPPTDHVPEVPGNSVALLRGRGVQIRSISDGIDPAISIGRLMLNMLATLAEYEWEVHSWRNH